MSDVITIKEIEYISEQDAADYIGYNVWSLQMWRYRNKPWRPPHYRIAGSGLAIVSPTLTPGWQALAGR